MLGLDINCCLIVSLRFTDDGVENDVGGMVVEAVVEMDAGIELGLVIVLMMLELKLMLMRQKPKAIHLKCWLMLELTLVLGM